MSTKTHLHSTESQQREDDHGYFRLTSLMQPYGMNSTDDPFIHRIMINEALMQLFHPDEYATMKTMTRPATTEEEDEDVNNKGKQIYSNQHQSKERNLKQSRRSTNLSVDIWKLSPELQPDYSKIPKQQFKNLLCQANPLYRQRLQQHLANPQLLSFVQKRAHLMSMRLQLEMEKDYWKHVTDKLLSAVEWLSQMPKDLTRRCSINWDYPRTQRNIRHRQRLTENKIKQIDEQIRVHSQKCVHCRSISEKELVEQNVHRIFAALKVMICDGLENLHMRFKQKKTLMQYDACDIDLLKSFYDLHPTEDQKLKAEKIWRAKRQYCQRQIHEIKTNLAGKNKADTSMLFNENHQHNVVHDNQQYQTPFLESFDLTMRTILENRRTNMENRTQKIISFQNTSSSI